MDTVYDLLADLPPGATLAAPPASMPAREVRTTAYRVGNYLRSRGVHEGSRVGIADDVAPKPVLSLLGAALLAAPVTFAPPAAFDGRAVVVPTDALDGYELGPGGQRVGYGGNPADPAAGHFEGGVWSENPAFPPVTFDGDVPALDVPGDVPTQAALLADAAAFAGTLDAEDEIALRSSLTDAGSVVAVLGALAAGATLLLPEGADGDPTGTLAVADEGGNAPESRVVAPADLR